MFNIYDHKIYNKQSKYHKILESGIIKKLDNL